jgi:hypothetical protein
LGGRWRELCAARGTQVYGSGGLVHFTGTTVHVSVVGSNLTNITVRGHCLSTL